MVGVFRPKPDARAIVQPEPTALGLFAGNFQPLTPPYPLDPFDVHDPTRLVQHRRDVGGQCRFASFGARIRELFEHVKLTKRLTISSAVRFAAVLQFPCSSYIARST